MQKQILFIHGGGAFADYNAYITFLKNTPLEIRKLKPRIDWTTALQNSMGNDYEVLQPAMPNKTNAQYSEWEIFFEKALAIVNEEIILVGHSLGAVFLAKYLALTTIPKKILSLHLVAGPFDNSGLNDESLASFELPDDLSNISKQTENIFIYHSKDDPVVPFDHASKYTSALAHSKLEVFEDRGHMKIEHFPELISNIRNSSK